MKTRLALAMLLGSATPAFAQEEPPKAVTVTGSTPHQVRATALRAAERLGIEPF